MWKVLSTTTVAVLLVAAAGCEEGPVSPEATTKASRSAGVTARRATVQVRAVHDHSTGEHRFELDRTELRSGWTTFAFSNEVDDTHFVLVERLPDAAGDITLEEYKEAVVEPFQEFMDLFNAGDPAPFAAFAETPAWFFDPGLTLMGGPGLTAPGRRSRATVELEPGRYVVECYVKTDGRFHSADGMIEMLTVTEEASGAPEPRAHLGMTLSSAGGIAAPAKIRPGKQTFAVHFRDQTVYPHLVGHDVHLVRLTDDTDVSELGDWMNWLSQDGLETPAPADFLGGIQDLPGGETGYFTATLTPGTYAWIGEIPDPAGNGMFEVFTVPGRVDTPR